MVFKIGEIDVSKLITPPKIEDTFRSQSVNYTLNGTAIIDRISEYTKVKITIEIPLIAKAEWDEIKEIIKPISFAVTVDDTSYTVHLNGNIPSPVLYSTEAGSVYSDIKLVFEEI